MLRPNDHEARFDRVNGRSRPSLTDHPTRRPLRARRRTRIRGLQRD